MQNLHKSNLAPDAQSEVREVSGSSSSEWLPSDFSEDQLLCWKLKWDERLLAECSSTEQTAKQRTGGPRFCTMVCESSSDKAWVGRNVVLLFWVKVLQAYDSDSSRVSL